jgi:hypothetical protein
MRNSRQQRRLLRAILAHVPYGLHNLFDAARYATILREPVARILSNYCYAKYRLDFDISPGRHMVFEDERRGTFRPQRQGVSVKVVFSRFFAVVNFRSLPLTTCCMEGGFGRGV